MAWPLPPPQQPQPIAEAQQQQPLSEFFPWKPSVFAAWKAPPPIPMLMLMVLTVSSPAPSALPDNMPLEGLGSARTTTSLSLGLCAS